MVFEKRLLQTYEGPTCVSTPRLTLLCQLLTSGINMSICNTEYLSQKISFKPREEESKNNSLYICNFNHI
jgi:hypothetical protein